MHAEIVKWSEVKPDSMVLIQGGIMKYLRSLGKVEGLKVDVLKIIIEHQGMEMEMGVGSDQLVAVIDKTESGRAT